MKGLVETYNELVEKVDNLREYIEVFITGLAPVGEEARKQVRKETNVLFRDIHNLSSDLRDALDKEVYKGVWKV